jgi:two-component system nitrogen regulation sensor histidine kinase NtrY
VQRAEREAAWREVARRIAHEIKNPLTAMRYALHRLQRRAELVPEAERAAVQQSLDAILEELKSLAAMADQFAQYARMPEPRLEPVDLAEIARGVAALHEPETVRLDLGDRPLCVRGDRLLLSRAMHNLVLNACEATTGGTPVELVARVQGATATFDVLDRGSGLPEHLRDRLFDPYVSTKNRGSGLGLSLVRDVAQQHGGRITLENRAGGGVCARLELPLAQEGGREAVTG